MNHGVQLRSLQEGDLPHIQAALGEQLAEAYPGGDAWLAKALEGALRGSADVIVAHAGEVVAGVLVTQVKARGVKLSCYWVKEEWRRRGVGSSLLRRALQVYGARKTYLTCDSSLEGAFTSLMGPEGFSVTGRLPGRYEEGRTEVVLTREGDEAADVRALSLTRPWSELVLSGGKDVENRTWRTRYSGLLVIHGAKSTSSLAAAHTAERGLPTPPDPEGCETGYLGVVHLSSIECHEDTCQGGCSPWAMGGAWHWRLRGAAKFPAPIPGPGRVGLWTPPEDVQEAARRLVD